MLNAKFVNQLIIAYKLSPFIKRAVIIKITVAVILYAYWTLGKSEVFRQLDLAVVKMKALDTRNENLMDKIKDVGMVNQAIQKMEFNAVDSGKVFAGPTLDAELLSLVGYHAEQHKLALVSLSQVAKAKELELEPEPELKPELEPKPAGKPAKNKLSQKQLPKAELPASKITSAFYTVAVKGSFGDIMGFIDGLVNDKRHLRLGHMTIATDEKSSKLVPMATVGFGVYVLGEKEQTL